ncbi:MAG: hypothetical protein HKO08_10940 [Erythrobacter sp.]|nr:hypothetical protein [Erythrobacter sp.]
MKKTAIILASLLLAACGDGPDFNVKVKGSAPIVKQELAKIGSGSANLGGVAPVSLASEGDALVFTVPAKEGYDAGRVKLAFTEESGLTKVDVTVDMPAVPMGPNQVLSEQKVESELRKGLKIWARDYGKFGTGASTDNIEVTMAAVAIAAQAADTNGIFFAGNGGSNDWAAGSTRDWDDASYDDGGGWGADSGADDYYADDGGWGAGG